mmetsp:Transcript_47727/g.97120  ORF Transcript_47727/g.97120 Transcript_47727/m.97120 type:complete len:210 (-) Transcript_47727:325-954(-)
MLLGAAVRQKPGHIHASDAWLLHLQNQHRLQHQRILGVFASFLDFQVRSTMGQQLWLHFSPSIFCFHLPPTVFCCHLQSQSTLLFQQQQRLSGEPRFRTGVSGQKAPIHWSLGKAPCQKVATLQQCVMRTSQSMNVGIIVNYSLFHAAAKSSLIPVRRSRPLALGVRLIVAGFTNAELVDVWGSVVSCRSWAVGTVKPRPKAVQHSFES